MTTSLSKNIKNAWQDEELSAESIQLWRYANKKQCAKAQQDGQRQLSFIDQQTAWIDCPGEKDREV